MDSSKKIATCVMLMVMAIISTATGVATAGTSVGFYKSTCPNVEGLVHSTVATVFQSDNTIAAALLRMQFHDCFVRGCDASLLINSTKNNQAEKDAGANASVRGYDLIDKAKSAVEKACPGVVSCADIISLATRDAVSLVGGPHWDVPTGRRDGRVSQAADVNLPSPSISVAQSISAFASRGLSAEDMTTLLGAHTIGGTHCSFTRNRLYNFQGTAAADPSMTAQLVVSLKKVCPQGSGVDAAIALDQGTGSIFDNSFYKQLLQGHGILQIDQELSADPSTSGFVNAYADSKSGRALNFGANFAQAIVKLGNVNVLTGAQGEIRHICSAIN